MGAPQNQLLKRRKMRGVYHDVGLRAAKVLNVILITLPFACCWLLYYAKHVAVSPSALRKACVIALYGVLFIVFGRIYEAFLVSINRLSEMIWSQLLAILITDGCMFIILWLMSGGFPFLPPALGALAAQLALSLLWCKCAQTWYFHNFSGQKVAIIYDHERGIKDLFKKYGLDKKFDVCLHCHVDEFLSGSMDVLDDMDVVFICGVHSHERNQILKYCVDIGVCVYVIPRVGDLLMSGAKRMHLFHLPMLRVGRYNPHPEYVLVKRVFDIIFSVFVIVITSPIMLAAALAIKLQDGGPVFYRQTRLTKDGREFKIIKFRSMRVDAEKDGVARLSAGENDKRITPVGRIIRACRLDELPQFFNILAGDMSVVGPRPERPEIAAQYEKEMPEFRLRLQTKAGLTGYAQVYGKYNTLPYDKLQLDLMYIASPSVIEDLKIIFATLKILFESESVEGVAEGAVTAMDTPCVTGKNNTAKAGNDI
jgi:exopolysaccharide biosynthesis polyprenyl glycosylphosphotransferase